MFSIIVGVVMAIAFIGMIVCVKKQNDNPNAKPLAVGLLLTVVVCAVVMLIHNMGDSGSSSVVESEMRYTASVPYMVGKKLAETMPGAKVLVVTGRPDPNSKFQQRKKEALQQGFGHSITDVVYDYPKVSSDTEDAITEDTMLEDIVTAKDMDRLLARHKDRNLVVMFIGLPYDMENMSIWRQFKKNPKKTPKLVLTSSNVSLLGGSIKSGLIVVAAVSSPGYKYVDKVAPESFEEAFNERYLLLTPDNVLQMAKKYPKLFQKR